MIRSDSFAYQDNLVDSFVKNPNVVYRHVARFSWTTTTSEQTSNPADILIKGELFLIIISADSVLA